jgi:hypothetical protein
MIFVSAKDAPGNFDLLRENYVFSFKKVSFTHFDFHILWAFAFGISSSDGAKLHFTTHRDRKEVAEQERYRWLVEGLDPIGICYLFAKARHSLHLEHMHLMLEDASPSDKAFIQSIPFFYAAEDIFNNPMEM